MRVTGVFVVVIGLFVSASGCSPSPEPAPPAPASSPEADPQASERERLFDHIRDKTPDHITVYGTESVSAAQFSRAYADITAALDAMDPRIRASLVEADAKMIVARDEAELVDEIDYYESIFPVEAIFTDIEGTDETLPGPTGVSTSKLELMYLVVYYSLLTDAQLATVYEDLVSAYDEAVDAALFTPGEAYEDGFVDGIHMNASREGALKYGSYLFGLYRIYFGNGQNLPGEFTVTTAEQLATSNPAGVAFIERYLDQAPR